LLSKLSKAWPWRKWSQTGDKTPAQGFIYVTFERQAAPETNCFQILDGEILHGCQYDSVLQQPAFCDVSFSPIAMMHH
jgi:hypothetical protein